MKQLLLITAVTTLLGSNFSHADEPAAKPDSKAESKNEVVKSTFLITGLHCPPCTRTVEGSLKSIKGVRSAKVDWNTKNAKVEFDEKVISAQQLSESIARTSHMMGGNMQYGGWLALKVDGVKNEDTAKKVQKILEQVKQVARVSVYPKQDAVGIAFKGEGKMTTQELVQLLKDEGVTATNYP